MKKTDREKAQQKVRRWKMQLLKSYEIREKTGLDEGIISKIYTGNGKVTDASIKKVLEAK
jgi:hypothetical protein